MSVVFTFNFSKNLAMEKSSKKIFSLYPFGKIYVCPTGRSSRTLFTAAEPAAQHSGAWRMDRRSQEHDSRTIKMPCSSVFSKLTPTRFFLESKQPCTDRKLMHEPQADHHKGKEANPSLLKKEEKPNLLKIPHLSTKIFSLSHYFGVNCIF